MGDARVQALFLRSLIPQKKGKNKYATEVTDCIENVSKKLHSSYMLIDFYLGDLSVLGGVTAIDYVLSWSALKGKVSFGHPENAVCLVGEVVVVRNDDEGDPLFPVQLLQELVDRFTGMGIEVTRRLVGKDHIGPQHQCPRYGDALLLSS